MKLISFMPCESVKNTDSGPTLVGFFRRYYPEQLPMELNFSSLLEVEGFDAYKFDEIGVEMISPSGETLFKKSIPFSYPFEDLEEGTFADFALGLDFEDIEISEPGRYIFHIFALNETVREAELIGTSHLEVDGDDDVSEHDEEIQQ